MLLPYAEFQAHIMQTVYTRPICLPINKAGDGHPVGCQRKSLLRTVNGYIYLTSTNLKICALSHLLPQFEPAAT